MTEKTIKTRFAPSPTGFMHIGNVRTALYSFLFARQNGGTFILRIEDTDQARKVQGALEQIQKTLKIAGLEWDEGPYIQTKRLDIYKEKIDQLLERGGAYYCFCTKDRLARARQEQKAAKKPFRYDGYCRALSAEEIKKKLADKEKYVVRQKVPTKGETVYEDRVFGKIKVQNSYLDDSVLIKSDGMPTYNFAHVVDDYVMGVTHVFRGSEFLSSTPKYVLLYDAFGWQRPVYIHLPPINKNAQEKLSKRDGDATFEDLIQKGYLPEAVINYIALLGWHPKDEQEIFSLKELISAFSLDGLSKSPAIFDIKKLNWMNGEYIRKMPFEEFHSQARRYYKGMSENIDRKEVSRLLQERIEKFSDIAESIDFFSRLGEYDVEMFTNPKMGSHKENAQEALKKAQAALSTLKEWKKESIQEALLGAVDAMGVKKGTLLWPVRVAISGKKFTPGGAIEIAAVLGKEESLRRIEHGIHKLEKQ